MNMIVNLAGNWALFNGFCSYKCQRLQNPLVSFPSPKQKQGYFLKYSSKKVFLAALLAITHPYYTRALCRKYVGSEHFIMFCLNLSVLVVMCLIVITFTNISPVTWIFPLSLLSSWLQYSQSIS